MSEHMAAEEPEKESVGSAHSKEIDSPDTPSNAAVEPAEKKVDDDTRSAVDGTRTGWALGAILLATYLAMFLVALDRTIIATAIPRITDTFNSLDDIGWYGSSYLLTACAFQLLYGRIYTFYSPKWVFLSGILFFELGSAICGAAPTSTAFIIGRAIAGLGSAGVFVGVIVIIVHCVPLHRRPMYTGFMGAVFGISSVIAPLMGGAFTDRVTWRWCFYINLPIGAVVIFIIILILEPMPPPNPSTEKSLAGRLRKLDPLGTLFFLPSIVCLLLALQWGGAKYAWSNGRIIALFVLFGVLLITFIGIQLWRQEEATVPPRLIKQRTVACGMWYTTCLGGSMMVFVYYIPIWFQAIKGVSAVQSGIMVLPLVLGLVIASTSAGILVSKLGYYNPFLYASVIVMSIGAGLFTTFTTTTDHPKWIGYQVIFGFGLGLGMQQASVAAQTVLPKKDVATGISLMMLGQTLGGSIFISVGQTVFANKLITELQQVLSGNLAALVTNIGATDLRNVVQPQDLPAVLTAYNAALDKTYVLGVCLACLAAIGAVGIEWQSVRKEVDAKKAAEGAP